MYSSNPNPNPAPEIPTERQVLAWLRKRVHPYCWGQSDRRKKNFTRTTRRKIHRFFQALRLGFPKGHPPTMRNALMMGHFAGTHILYFQADGRYDTPEVIICIDIDCHDRGTFEGERACVAWLIDNGFPGLFWSRSTNGRGVHAYLRVVKTGSNARGLDQALLGLERWLKYQLSVRRWDIQDIEGKGRPPIFSWGDERYELLGLRMGSLAKLPIEALDRPLALINTTLKTLGDLRRLGARVPGDREPARGEYNCTTYSLPIRDDPFDGIDAEDLKPFVPDSRSREWPLWVERMARIGLVEEDSMADVVFELAKWLLWIELHGHDDRQTKTAELLQRYILEKHNGCVTRLGEGKEAEALSHIERIVEGACSMPSRSKELFLRIRQRRQRGGYKRLIEIAPVLAGSGAEDAAASDHSYQGDYNCTTYSLPLRDHHLPPAIEDKIVQHAQTHRMRRSKGEYPLVRFARQLLGILWHNQGAARVHTDGLTEMAGNAHQQNDYKKALLSLGLLRDWTGTYRVGTASALYRLTDEAMLAFEAAHSQATEGLAV